MSRESDIQQMRMKGKIIVYTLACANIALNFVEWLVNEHYTLMGLAIQIVVSIALCQGFNRLRYLFVIGSAAVCALRILEYLNRPWVFLAQSVPVQVHNVMFIAYLLVCMSLLLFSKSVGEFFRSRKKERKYTDQKFRKKSK